MYTIYELLLYTVTTQRLSDSQSSDFGTVERTVSKSCVGYVYMSFIHMSCLLFCANNNIILSVDIFTYRYSLKFNKNSSKNCEKWAICKNNYTTFFLNTLSVCLSVFLYSLFSTSFYQSCCTWYWYWYWYMNL